MKINKELILQVAKNARLELTEPEIKEFEKDFKDILDAFSKISEVDTKNIKESFHPIEIKNHLRKDEIKESLSQEDALKNSKHRTDIYFKGPKAI